MQSPFKMIPPQNIILVDQRGNYLVLEVVSQFWWWASPLGIKVCRPLSSVLYLISDFLTLPCRLHQVIGLPRISRECKNVYISSALWIYYRSDPKTLTCPHHIHHRSSGISDLSVFLGSYTEWLILRLYISFMSAPGSLHVFWRFSARRPRIFPASTPTNMAVFFVLN